MARPMRRQLASFSSKERMFVMRTTWLCRAAFATRFLRPSKDRFTGLPKRGFQGLGEAGPLARCQKSCDMQGFAVAPQRQLAPMLGRLVHMHPHPIGVDLDHIALAAWRRARDAQARSGQRDALFAPSRDRTGAKGPAEKRKVGAHERRDGPRTVADEEKYHGQIHQRDQRERRQQHARRHWRTWPQHRVEQHAVFGHHGAKDTCAGGDVATVWRDIIQAPAWHVRLAKTKSSAYLPRCKSRSPHRRPSSNPSTPTHCWSRWCCRRRRPTRASTRRPSPCSKSPIRRKRWWP